MATVFRPHRLHSYDEGSILAEIKRVITQHFGGIPPRIEDFDKVSLVRSSSLRRHFGTWANAIRKAGFDYHGKNYEEMDLRRANYSEELMVSDLQRVKEMNGGQYFSQDYYLRNGGRYSVNTLKKHFNCSWETLLRDRFSLEPPVTVRQKVHRVRPKYTDEELISELKRVWDDLGRRPSYPEFKQLGRIGVRVYERRFGNWKSAIARLFANSDYQSIGTAGCHTTPELLIAELERLTGNANTGILSYGKYRQLGGLHSIGTFIKHFGSWRAAVNRVGHADGNSGKYTDEELFSEMQRLWETYGRQPTYRDMNRDGRISGHVFQKKFGSWIKSVHAFCADRESANEDEAVIESDPEPHTDLKSTPPPAISATPILVAADYVASTAKTVLVDSRRVAGIRLRFRVFQRDQFRCVYCGRSPKTHESVVLHADHKVPWSRGGFTEFENLQTTCADCNVGKSDHLPE
jgi:hypothetical protein